MFLIKTSWRFWGKVSFDADRKTGNTKSKDIEKIYALVIKIGAN